MFKSIIGGITLAALVSPAMANEYWVEYDYSTHTCSIVEKQTPQNSTDVTQNGPTATPAGTSATGGPISDVPQGFAAPTNKTPPVIASGAPNAADTTPVAPGTTAPANPTATAKPTGAPNGAAAPGAPTKASKKFDENDPFAGLAASWARKKAAAEAAGTANVTTVEIGDAMRTREDAEAEMLVMRKCGLKN